MAKLVFHSGPYRGKSVGVPTGKTIVMGRNRDIELPLPDLKLSRRHCAIAFKDDKYTITDLTSTNGTFVNGERIQGEVPLNDFDRIVVGDTEIEFHSAEKVPLPLNFDAAAADPFGLAEDDEEVPLEALQALDEVEGAAAAPADAPSLPDEEPAPPQPLQPPAEIAAAEAQEVSAPQPIQPPPEIAAADEDYDADDDEPGEAAAAPDDPVPIPAPPDDNADDTGESGPTDPLEAALSELDLPLPPDPPPLKLADQSATKPKFLFCASCEGSIPMLDYDLAVARVVEGHMLCKECLAKGANPAADAPATQPPHATPDAKKKSVSDILKALDDEAVIIDTAPKRPGRAPADAVKQKAAPKDASEEFGEEVEEIR